MKKILVPTDFSHAARVACEYAASLAKAFEAEIILLYVFMEPAPTTEAPVAWVVTGSALQEENDALIHDEVKYLKEKFSVHVLGTAQVGFKSDTIASIAKEIAADLIVMGMKRGTDNKILGSTTLAALRKTNAPVLVVPEAVSFKPIKYVVLATDFSELKDTSGLSFLLKLVNQTDATLQVLHVQKKGVTMNAAETPGKLQLSRVLSHITFWYDEIEDNDIEHGILNYINNHPTDLLVMIAHHHGFFDRVFGAVHTRNLSFETPLPLLVLEEKT